MRSRCGCSSVCRRCWTPSRWCTSSPTCTTFSTTRTRRWSGSTASYPVSPLTLLWMLGGGGAAGGGSRIPPPSRSSLALPDPTPPASSLPPPPNVGLSKASAFERLILAFQVSGASFSRDPAFEKLRSIPQLTSN